VNNIVDLKREHKNSTFLIRNLQENEQLLTIFLKLIVLIDIKFPWILWNIFSYFLFSKIQISFFLFEILLTVSSIFCLFSKWISFILRKSYITAQGACCIGIWLLKKHKYTDFKVFCFVLFIWRRTLHYVLFIRKG